VRGDALGGRGKVVCESDWPGGEPIMRTVQGMGEVVREGREVGRHWERKKDGQRADRSDALRGEARERV
jgi:hypothetical protein